MAAKGLSVAVEEAGWSSDTLGYAWLPLAAKEGSFAARVHGVGAQVSLSSGSEVPVQATAKDEHTGAEGSIAHHRAFKKGTIDGVD